MEKWRRGMLNVANFVQEAAAPTFKRYLTLHFETHDFTSVRF